MAPTLRVVALDSVTTVKVTGIGRYFCAKRPVLRRPVEKNRDFRVIGDPSSGAAVILRAGNALLWCSNNLSSSLRTLDRLDVQLGAVGRQQCTGHSDYCYSFATRSTVCGCRAAQPRIAVRVTPGR